MRNLRTTMMVMLAVLASGAAVTTVARAAADDQTARVERAGEVYRELIQGPDRELPEKLLSDCKCVAVFPKVLKGAIGIGARYGKGVISCRNAEGKWGPPAFFTLGGGSWGFQIGAEATDVVLFFMTENSAKSLLTSKVTLGAKAGVAAGPAGRSAEASTDARLEAEIYSYGRSKGLFAGLSLEGARIATDGKANRAFYGEPVTAQAILFEHQVPKRPEVVEKFVGALP